MSKWEMIKLSDMFTLQMGKTPSRDNPAYWNGDKKWVSISDLGKISKYISNTKECISDIAISETGIKITPKDTVIMSFKLSIGKTAITCEDIYTNEAIMSFIDKGIYEFDLDYIYYLFSGKDWNEGTNKAVMGITLNKATLSQIRIPLPPINLQKQIAKNLDKVTRTIDICNAILEKLDLLVKARFVEMFGDPVTNPYNWDIKSVIDECECMVPGRDKPKSFTGDIPWITIEDLIVNGITYNSKSGLGLTKEEIKQVNRKTIPIDSVIMSCVGNLGICSIAGKEMVINQQLHSFQCKDTINNVYLMFNLTYRKDYMNKWASNTTVLYMNKTICNSIPIMLPPLELQNQFADFVKQTDKSKSEVKQVLEKAETLKKALMQEYFG